MIFASENAYNSDCILMLRRVDGDDFYQNEARIYKGSLTDFIYMSALSDTDNESQKYDTIANVMKQIEN